MSAAAAEMWSGEPEEEGGTVTSQTGAFAHVPVWILSVGLTGSELAVYVSLRSFANQAGNARPYVKTIAERAGVTVRTAEKAISRMRELGLLITSQRHRRDGSVAGCDYHLRDIPPGARTGGPVQADGGVPSEPPGGSRPGGRSKKEHTSEHTNGTHEELMTPRPDGGVDDDTLDLDLAVDDLPAKDSFKVFYDDAYPLKAARPKALEAWAKAVRKARPSAIIAAARIFATDRNREEKFTPHPATWLNQERWNDGPLPARGGKTDGIAARNALATNDDTHDFWSS